MNIRSKQWMTFCGLAIAGTLMLGGKAQAAQISFNGDVLISQNASPAGANFTFSGLVVSGLPNGDTLNGAGQTAGTSFTISNAGGFVLSGPVSYTTAGPNTLESANFSVGNGTIDINGGAAGSLSGNISFIDVTYNSDAQGNFQVQIGLSNLTVVDGTSAILANVGTNNGTADMQFDFSSSEFTDLASLVGITSADYNSLTPLGFTDSITGTLSVPEPASLALLGTGLLGLAFVFKRRLLDAAGNDMQA